MKLLIAGTCVAAAVAFPVAAANPSDLVYRIPNMDNVLVNSNLTYKTVNNHDLKADLYLPQNTSSNASLPVIIFVLGDASPEILREAKDWPVFHSYGRLAGASGFAGITFNHRSSENFTQLPAVRSDIADLIQFVRTNSTAFSVDKDRICLWFFSGAGPHLSIAMGTNVSFVRCVVAYYPLLAPGRLSEDAAREFSPIEQLKRATPHLPPVLLAKAGRDDPRLNALIDDFRNTAGKLGVSLEFLEHPQGRHAFDIRDDDETSREILRKTMRFIQRYLPENK
jgi:acetyl esterase/lipase